MVQSAGRRKGDKDKDNVQWCQYMSVLDVKLSKPSDLPDPPITLYLEEVPMGMRGGKGDNSPASGHLRGLQRVIAHSCAETACRALLWLAVGGIFGQADPDDASHDEELSDFRANLGQSWYLISLALASETGNDRNMRDWVCAALPFVFAQAIYRILCDGFSEDRHFFASHADRLVCKVTQVVHFETTGFQMSADTVRKERRRLLQRHIFKRPDTNQREYLRGQRRQEMLESQNTHVGDHPLKFGEEDVQPLEDTQLDHVMQGRAELRKTLISPTTPSAGGRPRKEAPLPNAVPPELSVERYAHLSVQGNAQLDSQLAVFAEIMGEVSDEDDDLDLGTPLNSVPTTPTSPFDSTSTMFVPQSPGRGDRRQTVTWHGDEEEEGGGGDFTPQALWLEAYKSPTPAGRNRKSLLAMRRPSAGLSAAKFASAKEAAREAKAKEEKARKLRQDLLHKKIVVDKLRPSLCARELNTTWVSPCQMTICSDAKDRSLQRRASSDARMLKMSTRPVQTRPLSMPALRAKVGELRTGSREDDGSSVGKASKVSGGLVHGRASSIGVESSLPRVGSAPALHSGNSVVRTWATKAEDISLEPPPRLSAKLIMRRLEDQSKASKQMSFALYMKEYDIFTDILKRPVDDKLLKAEEDKCLSESEGLLNGPPKKRLAPRDLRMKGPSRVQAA